MCRLRAAYLARISFIVGSSLPARATVKIGHVGSQLVEELVGLLGEGVDAVLRQVQLARDLAHQDVDDHQDRQHDEDEEGRIAAEAELAALQRIEKMFFFTVRLPYTQRRFSIMRIARKTNAPENEM